MSAVAELRGVTKQFESTVALRDVSLTLEPGTVTAILGPNGAGKTTAVRLLLGLTAPTKGEVSVFGGNPRHSATRLRIGAMLQVAKVPETLRVREHIEQFRAYYPAPLPFAELVEMAGLKGLEHRLFGTLSGGEKQRVLFAIALAGDPPLLMLDEPTVGLDVESRRTLWERIHSLGAEGRSVLLTTHYLDEADALAHRIVVIGRGEVVAAGTPSEIKARAAGRRVRCVTALALDVVRAIAGVQSARRVGEVTELLSAHAEPVVRELLHRDATLSALEVTGAGLEEAFIALTSRREEAA